MKVPAIPCWVASPMSSSRERSIVTASIAFLIAVMLSACSGCPLPDQSKVPPTVRIQYCTGNPCGPLQSSNSNISPDQPLTIFVTGSRP